jgi:hypothetical protein
MKISFLKSIENRTGKVIISVVVLISGLTLAFSLWGGVAYEYIETEDRARPSLVNTLAFNWSAILTFAVCFVVTFLCLRSAMKPGKRLRERGE